MARIGHRLNATFFVFTGIANPRHAVTAHFDRQATNFCQQLWLAVHARQGTVAQAEHFERPRGTGQRFVRPLLNREVVRRPNHPQDLSTIAYNGMRVSSNPADVTTGQDEPILDLGRPASAVSLIGHRDRLAIIRVHRVKIGVWLDIQAVATQTPQTLIGRTDVEHRTGLAIETEVNVLGVIGQLQKTQLFAQPIDFGRVACLFVVGGFHDAFQSDRTHRDNTRQQPFDGGMANAATTKKHALMVAVCASHRMRVFFIALQQCPLERKTCLSGSMS